MAEVLLENRPGGIALVTLNRPDSLNSLSDELLSELAQHLAACGEDDSIRCLVLTGAGRAFCAGGDVKEFAEGRGVASGRTIEGGGEESRSPAAQFHRSVREQRRFHDEVSYRLHMLPKPTVAMVNGPAVGAGLSIALACDMRIASEKARFGTAFRNVGLSGDFGGTFYLTKLVGIGTARQLYLTGEIIDAEAAQAIRMVNRVVPHDKLEEQTLALAEELAAGPPLAYARMKEVLALAEHGDLRSVLDTEAVNHRLSFLTDDHLQAARAFVEKRTPTFSGN